MVLLFTASLKPQGPANLAAIRFSTPIHIHSIRIFPHGYPLFPAATHNLTSQTSPDAFYLDLFFNAQPLSNKIRPSNALLPTSISYSGGLMDFALNMGTDYATRLMIVKGSFQCLTLAIYGSLISDPLPVLLYQPNPITIPQPQPLSSHFDPANAPDPTALAKSLLALIPNAPSLPLAIRLMFCLKPTEDDWDNPDFPHIYANLDNDSEDYDLDSIVANLDRPIPEQVSQESLDTFIERLTDFIGPPSVDQAYQIANALNLSASQTPLFSQTLLNALDLPSIFTASTLADPPTLTTLTDACANVLIARHFATQTPLLAILSEIRQYPRSRLDKPLITALDRLKDRILAWQAFEDALSPSTASSSWSQAAGLVYYISRHEQALGNWLNSMITHQDILAKLSQSPPTAINEPPPVLFTQDSAEDQDREVTHAEFMSFVRTCIGIVSVLAVLSWADSVGNDDCRERTLAVIQLWQGIEGYREIVNHLFLLRQLTRRLKWITTDNDPPRHSGLLAERVLCSLLLPPVLISPPPSISSHQNLNIQPNPITLPALNPDLVQTVLSLSQPLAFIPEHERLCFRKLALVVDDGLPAAIEELVVMFESEVSDGGNGTIRKPISLRRVRILRVGVGLVLRELEFVGRSEEERCWDGDEGSSGEEGEGEWKILEAFNAERTYGFIERLVDLFKDLVDDLIGHFPNHLDPTNNTGTTTKTGSYQRELVEQLFATTRELLLLIYLVMPVFTITARGMRKVVSGIVELVGCADWVFEIYPDKSHHLVMNGGEKNGITVSRRGKETDLQRVAKKTRKTCVHVLKSVVSSSSSSTISVEPRMKTCKEEVVFRTLLMCSQVGGDMVKRIQRLLELIQVVLPSSTHQEAKIHWTTNVFPLVLHDLRLFIRLLPVQSQVEFLEMLIGVDENGDVGVGEWLIEEEIKEVEEVLKGLVDGGHEEYDYEGDGEGEKGEKEEGTSNMEGVEGEKKNMVEEGRKEIERELKKREREVRRAEKMVNQYRVYVGLQFLGLLASSSSSWLVNALSRTPTLTQHISRLFLHLLDAHYTSPPFTSLLKSFSPSEIYGKLSEELKGLVLLGALRLAQGDVTDVNVGDCVSMLKDGEVKKLLFSEGEYMDMLRLEVGRLCAVCADRVGAVSVQVAEIVLGVLEWMAGVGTESRDVVDVLSEVIDGNTSINTDVTRGEEEEERNKKLKILKGITPEAFTVLCDSLTMILPTTKEDTISIVRKTFTVEQDEDFIPIPTELPDTLILSLSNISSLLTRSHPTTTTTSSSHSHARTGSLSTLTPQLTDIAMGSRSGGIGGERPTTPKGTKTPDILGTIISPPTALLRSPAATGLTKTYMKNDFRQLRQVPSARLNTSRLPSMHVDDFESGAAPGPTVSGASISPLIVPVPIPMSDVSAFGGLLNMGQ